MKPIYDVALRDSVRVRMSPANRETVSAISSYTGIAIPTLYSWRSQWQKQGLLVPATNRPPEQWGAVDKLAAVIQSAGLSGPELGSFCRERGLDPKQVARWRQAAEDANGPSAPSMTDQRELQRTNQELIRQNKKLERELQKKERALTEAATLLWRNASAQGLLSKKFNEIFWALIPAEARKATVAVLQEGMNRGASIKAMADWFGGAPRTLRRWGLMIRAQDFNHDQRKGAERNVAHRFSTEERQNVLLIVNDPRFADLSPGQIVAILAEEGI